MYKFSIAAIASPLEANYIQEWVDYHKRIGVEHFYIATNDWVLDTNDPAISTMRLDGRGVQTPYYTWCVRNLVPCTQWCAFIDIDEFIKCESIEQLVKGHESDDAICLSWRLFGSSNLHFDGTNYSVLKRFTHRQSGFNKHVKVVVNLQNSKPKYPLFANPHWAFGIVTKSIDGRVVNGPYDLASETRLNDASPWIAHFFCKTPEEWKKKQERGRVDVPPGSPEIYRKDNEFEEHDLNDVEDTSLIDKYNGGKDND